jgi:hypothetical protein
MFKETDDESISGDEPADVTLETAQSEIGELPIGSGEVNDVFIGFINGRNETIQFSRFSEDEWLIDVPVLKHGRYSYSLQCDNLTTKTVQSIVELFFKDQNWDYLCKLKKI